jgi:hypothetical protein
MTTRYCALPTLLAALAPAVMLAACSGAPGAPENQAVTS